jgi:hypothetical protein
MIRVTRHDRNSMITLPTAVARRQMTARIKAPRKRLIGGRLTELPAPVTVRFSSEQLAVYRKIGERSWEVC